MKDEIISLATLGKDSSSFIYATIGGQIGIYDIRSKKPPIVHDFGKSRGILTKMIYRDENS